MLKKSTMKKKLIISMSVVMLLAAMVVVTAFAEAETGATLTGGSLSGDVGFSDFAVTLDGTPQTDDATWAVTAADATGTGSGWHMQLTLTQLTEYVGAAYVVDNPKLLPTGSITVSSVPTMSAADGTSSPANTVTTIVGAAAQLDTGSAVTLLSAVADGGMGTYTGDMGVTLSVRADAYAATYKSDALIDMVSGPSA